MDVLAGSMVETDGHLRQRAMDPRAGMGMGSELEGRNLEANSFLLVHQRMRVARVPVDASRVENRVPCVSSLH